MMRTMIACAAATFLMGVSYAADEKAELDRIRTEVVQIGDATMKGNYAFVIDHTYDKVVDLLGGQEKAVKITTDTMKQMESQGFRISSHAVSMPEKIVKSGENQFCVVPTALEMSFPKGKIRVKSYQLGISHDQGKSWKYVSGSSLDKPEARKLILPDMPQDLKLPEDSKPEILPD